MQKPGNPELLSQEGERNAKSAGNTVDWRKTKILETEGARQTDPFRRAADEIFRSYHHDGMHKALDFFVDEFGVAKTAKALAAFSPNRQRNRKLNAEWDRLTSAPPYGRDSAPDAAPISRLLSAVNELAHAQRDDANSGRIAGLRFYLKNEQRPRWVVLESLLKPILANRVR